MQVITMVKRSAFKQWPAALADNVIHKLTHMQAASGDDEHVPVTNYRCSLNTAHLGAVANFRGHGMVP